ncbi:MAG: BMC domain-containing protein [Aminipila sp.]
MECCIIKSPSKATVDILMRRKGTGHDVVPQCLDAIGLVQGRMIEMIVAVDIAEKAVGVSVEEIKGSCPQNMILIAIFGETASVEEAIKEIKIKWENHKY